MIRYVRDILANTSRSVEQVTVQPDGKWELHVRPEPVMKSNGLASSDDDDDLVEIIKSGDSIRMSAPRMNGTPAAAVAPNMPQVTASSTVSRTQSTNSAKRPAPVIDLTSSGDDDDDAPPPRQPKRQHISSSVNGFSVSSAPVYRPASATLNGYQSRP